MRPLRRVYFYFIFYFFFLLCVLGLLCSIPLGVCCSDGGCVCCFPLHLVVMTTATTPLEILLSLSPLLFFCSCVCVSWLVKRQRGEKKKTTTKMCWDDTSGRKKKNNNKKKAIRFWCRNHIKMNYIIRRVVFAYGKLATSFVCFYIYISKRKQNKMGYFFVCLRIAFTMCPGTMMIGFLGQWEWLLIFVCVEEGLIVTKFLRLYWNRFVSGVRRCVYGSYYTTFEALSVK